MDNIQWLYSLIILLLLMASAFFSSSETALTSANRLRLEQYAIKGNPGAKKAIQLLDRPQEMISAILIGNNIVNIASSTIATVFFTNLLGGSGALVATITMTILVLIFGEVLPKSIAQEQSEYLSIRVAKPISNLSKLVRPIAFVLSSLSNSVVNLFFKDMGDSPTITEEELKTLVEVGAEEGVLDPSEERYISNVFSFSDATAMDMMKPRTSVVALNIDISREEFLDFLANNRYSRIPVYGENIDDIKGVLYMKDIVQTLANQEKVVLKDIIRDAYFVSESAKADNIFRELKRRNLSIAIVIDEYAGTSGVITMEDIVEELVGHIDDEYDLEDREIMSIAPFVYILDLEIRIDKINEFFNLKLVSQRSDSIGGFVIEAIDQIPEEGEQIETSGIIFTILERKGQKLTKIKMDLKNYVRK